MANAKLVLDRRRAKDKTTQTPLRIVIRHRDTSASISTNVLLREDQWDGENVRNHPREKQLNILLSKQILETLMIRKNLAFFHHKGNVSKSLEQR